MKIKRFLIYIMSALALLCGVLLFSYTSNNAIKTKSVSDHVSGKDNYITDKAADNTAVMTAENSLADKQVNSSHNCSGKAKRIIHNNDIHKDGEYRVLSSVTEVNPLYASEISESDLVQEVSQSEPTYLLTNNIEYKTVEEAGEALREYMKNHVRSFRIRYYLTDVNADTKQLTRDIVAVAKAHTGNPTDGDYIQWQYGSYYCHTSGEFLSDYLILNLDFTVTYYVTDEQERMVDERVKEILASLDLKGKNTYEKIQTIYDYLRENVEYDNDHDDDYLLKYTAYAALIDKKAVCQGYAVALYRLLLESGIDNRVIAGTGDNGTTTGNHAWNIIRFGKQYYNVDVTWDSSSNSHDYFMKSPNSFDSDHSRDERYLTDEFRDAYPMWSQNCLYTFAAGCIDLYDLLYIPDGVLRNRFGEMYDTNSDGLISKAEGSVTTIRSLDVSGISSIEGIQYFSYIRNVSISDYKGTEVDLSILSSVREFKVSGQDLEYIVLGSLSTDSSVDFNGSPSLSQVVFKGNPPSFADKCFEGSNDVTVYYPALSTAWADIIDKDYGGTKVIWKVGDETTAYNDRNMTADQTADPAAASATPAPTGIELPIDPLATSTPTAAPATQIPTVAPATQAPVVTAEPTQPPVTPTPTVTAAPATQAPVVTIAPATQTPTVTDAPATPEPTGIVLPIDPLATPTVAPDTTAKPTDRPAQPTIIPIVSASAPPTAASDMPQSTSDTSASTQTGIQAPDLKLKVVITSAKNNAKRTITVKWKSLNGADMYQVRYSTSKKFTKAKTKKVIRKTKLKIKNKKLTVKKTYYIRVRAVYNVDGTTKYGAWSKVKKVKVKK